jgi:hypothetical protein
MRTVLRLSLTWWRARGNALPIFFYLKIISVLLSWRGTNTKIITWLVQGQKKKIKTCVKTNLSNRSNLVICELNFLINMVDFSSPPPPFPNIMNQLRLWFNDVLCSEYPFPLEVKRQETHKMVTNIVSGWLHSYAALLVIIVTLSTDIMIIIFPVRLERFKGWRS